MRRIAIASLVVLAAGGCQNRPPPAPMAVPTIELAFDAFAGTSLSGPVAADPPGLAAAAIESLATRTRLFAFGPALEADGSTASALAQLVLVDRDDQPIAGVARLLERVRVLDGEVARGLLDRVLAAPPQDVALIADRRAALPRGVTLSIDLSDPASPTPRALRLDLSRPSLSAGAETIDVTIGLRDQLEIRDEAAAGDAQQLLAPLSQVEQAERVLLAPLDVTAARVLALVVPLRLSDTSARQIVAIIEIARGNDSPEHTQMFDATTARVAASMGAIRGLPGSGAFAVEPWPGFETALRLAHDPATRRRALMFIALQTGSTVASDMLLSATDDVLQDFLRSLEQSMATSTLNRSAELLGWLMDLVSLRQMQKYAAADALSDELRTVLLIHTGEAGRDPGTLDQVLRVAASRPVLIDRLAAENQIALEDSSPAARVRAYEWLAARQLAPPGYDPLGEITQRRAAIDKAQDNSARR